MKERVAAGRVRYKKVDAAVAVEIAERRITRVVACSEPEAGRRLGERAVAVVTVDDPSSFADKKKVEVAIVVEIHEECFSCAADVGDASLRGDVLERAVPTVPQQVAALPSPALGADDEEIEPAIIVEIRKRRKDSTGGKSDARPAGDIHELSPPDGVQMRDSCPSVGRPHGHEQIVSAVAVEVAGGECGLRVRHGPERSTRGSS